MRPVMRMHADLGTYVEGFMVGACICKCPKNPKKVAACSGDAAEGFEDAVKASGFELVRTFEMDEVQEKAINNERKWACAAPKLLQAGGADGHKIRTMTERWYSPHQNVTVTVEYQYTEKVPFSWRRIYQWLFETVRDKGTRLEKREFSHGESVPSCETCQKLTPMMLCDNHKECP